MDIKEKDARLRYFYLIDTDPLTERIAAELKSEQNANPEILFDSIFKHIKQLCERYLNFIWSPNSFNNSDNFDIGLSQILQDVLKYHCILHGFLSAVEKDSQNRERIKISGAKDAMLQCGYFSTNFYKNNPASASNNDNIDENLSQRYNQRKKSFNTNSDSYSYSILINRCQDFCNDFPNVSACEGNWACFIYTMPEVLTLNKTINNFQNSQSKVHNKYNKSLIKNYNKLFSCYKEWYYRHNLTLEDKILFESAMEPIYGFRFFFYASKLIHKMHTASFQDTDLTYKDLEGTAMLRLIQQTAQLPVIYNRSVFLAYAIRSVLSGKTLESQNHQESSNSLFTTLSARAVPKELLILSGMEHIRVYLQKLKYVALPLLEDIWDVIIYKLNQNLSPKDNLYINIETYRSCLTDNYSAIANDYSRLFEKDTKEKKSVFRETNFYEELNFPDIDTIYQDFCFPAAEYSTSETASFKNLLSGYFKKERFTSPEPDLYQQYKPFMVENKFPRGIFNNELKLFNQHTGAILAYAKTLTPPT